MQFKKLIIKLTKKFLKRDLEISNDLPLSYLIGVCLTRFAMMIRGKFTFGFKKRGKRFFRGKKVELHCKKYICIGNCVSFHDYVLINGLSKNGVYIGDNCTFGLRTIIKTSGSIASIGKGFKIGHNSTMGNDCFVGAAGGVEIGDFVAIGQNVRFHSENHEFRDANRMICEQGVTNKGITVGSDCWIGAGAVILDGVNIGNGCVIGANTLVNKSIPDFSIAVGNPVKIIGNRKNINDKI